MWYSPPSQSFQTRTNDEGVITLVGRLAFLVVVVYWSFRLFTSDPPHVFLDHANLMIHEAGHPVFGVLGDFMGTLGGTLMQLLVPIIVSVSFVLQRHWYGVGFGVFWVGDNLVNIGVYMADATVQWLPRVGAGSHDWHKLFSRLGLLEYDTVIGLGVMALGRMVVLLGVLIMGFVVWRGIKTL